jgi:sulfur dioxygenase
MPFATRQLFDRDSCTYTYILRCSATGEAILIDPVIELADRDIDALDGMEVKRVTHILNTHVHADHITGSAKLRAALAARDPAAPAPRTVISRASGAVADVLVEHGDAIRFGECAVGVRAVPGHTPGCVAYVADDLSAAFVGDAILIRGCGRTDFQGGDPGQLYDSVKAQILGGDLPDATVLYVAHDYSGRTVTTVGEEKRLNPRLTLDRAAFVRLMEERFDGSNYPGKIDASLPANMVCGVFEDGRWDPAGKPVAHPSGWTWNPADARKNPVERTGASK